MQLTKLTELICLIIKDLYGLNDCPSFDWHPSIERDGGFYQSSICDRLSDCLKISPATLARSIQGRMLTQFEVVVDIDNRGYIFIEAKNLDPVLEIILPKSVLIYIQPPRTSTWSLYYCKFLALIAIQLELLRLEKVKVQLYIPGSKSGNLTDIILDANQFYGKEGFKLLLSLLSERRHSPILEDLFVLEKLKFLNNEAESLVIWLTSDLLSLPNVAAAIDSLRKRSTLSSDLNIRTVKFESGKLGDLSSNFSETGFLESFERYGLAFLFYIAELEHALDLDLQTPGLENGLNLKWLSRSLIERFSLLPVDSKPTLDSEKQLGLNPSFLLTNMPYMQQRAALYGDSIGFLAGLRKVLSHLHMVLNKGQIEQFSQMNIPASFPMKISSIIEGF